MTPHLTTLNDPHSAAAEAYQSLRTSLEFSRLGHDVVTLLLAAVDSTPDKSSAVANLAVVMAQAGDRVVLVDGDLRRPQQHEIFGLPNQQGLSTWLQSGGDPPLQHTAVDGLQILVSGPVAGNPVAMLSTKRLGERLATLRQQADYVLVDAPPVLAVTDAALWASQVDGVVLLVNAGATKRDEAQRAKTVLEGVQAKLLGAVLLNAEKGAGVSGYQR
jgi:capsular exopolysaccharide synthesis family protein